MLAITALNLFRAFSDGPRSLHPVRDQLKGQSVLLMVHGEQNGHQPSDMLVNDLRVWLQQNGAMTVTVCLCQHHDTWRCASNQKLKDKLLCVCDCHKAEQLQRIGAWKELR